MRATDYKFPETRVKGIRIHWTAGRYGQAFDEYHFCVDNDGAVLQNKECPPGVWTSHTWKDNSNNIGIAAMAMYNATSENYGDYPVTKFQLEAICALCAKIMLRYRIMIENVMTHAEAADRDGYGPATTCERWDFWKEGPVMKEKILYYLKRLKEGKS
jgi:N-acetyl-anhydromuramyl-L-alanine amidase AmpD